MLVLPTCRPGEISWMEWLAGLYWEVVSLSSAEHIQLLTESLGLANEPIYIQDWFLIYIFYFAWVYIGKKCSESQLVGTGEVMWLFPYVTGKEAEDKHLDCGHPKAEPDWGYWSPDNSHEIKCIHINHMLFHYLHTKWVAADLSRHIVQWTVGRHIQGRCEL